MPGAHPHATRKRFFGRSPRPDPLLRRPAPAGLSRRAALGSVAVGAVTAGAALAPPAEAAAPDTKTVSAFLPPFGAEGLYLFVPSPRETPSIRAGADLPPPQPCSSNCL